MLGENIKYRRKCMKLSQSAFAALVGVSSSTIGMYEQNRRLPDIQMIRKMAEVFECSTDELLGIDDLRIQEGDSGNTKYNYFTPEHSANAAFAHRVENCLQERNMTISDFASSINIDPSRLSEILYSSIQPVASEIVSMAQGLNVTTDYILGQSSDPSIIARDLINVFEKLNRENRYYIMGQAIALLKEEESKYPYNVGSDGGYAGFLENVYPSSGTEG